MDLTNIFDMLKNPQALKMQAEEMQKKMNSIRATGQAGGGMVKITLSGNMDLLECLISVELSDLKDIPLLQDLIRAAHHNATEKIREAIQKELAGSLGELSTGIPFGDFIGNFKGTEV
ncbi:MAG: YbaB/EbfC family nucleoid-associated protein [Rectinema sp.]